MEVRFGEEGGDSDSRWRARVSASTRCRSAILFTANSTFLPLNCFPAEEDTCRILLQNNLGRPMLNFGGTR